MGRVPRSRAWASLALLAPAALALCGLCCAPEPVAIPDDLPDGALVLRPGDSLLEHAGRLTVRRFPRSNLPPAMGDRLAALWSGEDWSIAADDWVGGGLLPAEASAGLGFDSIRELRRWQCHPALRLDLRLGRLELIHGGRLLRPLFQTSAARELQWRDDEAQLLFWWVADSATLVALGSQPPAELRYGYHPDAALGWGRHERRIAAGSALSGADDWTPTTAAELLSRVSVGAVNRPALAAPAPCSLEVQIDVLAGDQLQLALAIEDLGLAWAPVGPAEASPQRGQIVDQRLGSRRLRPRSARGDGVVFAVEVTLDGVVYPVWARQLQPGKGWREESIDLAFFAGRSVTLSLITRPAAAGSTDFDNALWGDLTLQGPVSGPPATPHVVLLDLPGLTAADLASGQTPAINAWARSQEPGSLDRWDRVSAPAVTRPGVRAADVTAVGRATASATAPVWSTSGDAPLAMSASLLSGLRPAQHGLLGANQRLPPSGCALVARLAAAGYETLARTEGGHLVPELGFAGSFSRFDFQRLDLDQLGGGSWSRELARLSRRRSARPLFLFLSSARMLPPSSEAADALAQLDALVAPFLRDLDEALGQQPTLIVLTSDQPRPSNSPRASGDPGDSGRPGVPGGLHGTVPLWIRWPPGWHGASGPGSDGESHSTLDVAATILDVAGLAPDQDQPGQSLAAH